MTPTHYPVMYREVLQFLRPSNENEECTFFDGTLGEGGHSLKMLQSFPNLKVVGVDADEVMLSRAKERLSDFSNRTTLINSWNDEFLANYPPALNRPNLILFDLGISIFHYEGTGRGFSFRKDERLDMRLDTKKELDAYYIVNNYSSEQLKEIFSKWGEERYSNRIACAIVKSRESGAITTTLELANLIREAVPAAANYQKTHPATQVFQALRIEVNSELQRLNNLLSLAYKVLAKDGVIGVITFHSLEDRIVKNFFNEKHRINRASQNKYLPSALKPVAQLLFNKPLVPTQNEIAQNPPSRSAKLRLLKKLEE